MLAWMRKRARRPLPIGRSMAEHRATVRWEQAGGPFAKRQYSRAHTWSFDGGVTVPAAASPHAVPLQFTDASAVDPEAAYIAAIAGFEVLRYDDEAVGRMAKNEQGRYWVAEVDLAPRITWAEGKGPSEK